MKTPSAHLLTGFLVATATLPALGGDWPGWRGADGKGIAGDKNLPLKWSPSENVRWHVELPERGNSSPIVWGDRVFVTQAVSADNRRTLMCFDRANGKLVWQSGVTYAEREQTQRDNPYCSATPVTDGERVIASFGSAGLYCYDFAGKELWHRDLGKMNHMFGSGSSPMLAGDLCVLNFGPDEKARLVAVNKRTGEIAWEAQPPKVEASEAPRGPGGPGGGRDGFGPGQMIAPQVVAQGDKNGDKALTKGEFAGLADAWFDKLDKDKAGKLDPQVFGERFGEILPPPEGFAPPGEGGRRGGFGPARGLAFGLFSAADTNKDGALTREEWTASFAKWFVDWDSDKTGALAEARIREGINAALPRPQFGGPGGRGGPGGPGGRGGGRGASWSTPLLITAGDREELAVSVPGGLGAYDPKSGRQLWLSKGLGETIYSSPVWGENTLVAMSSGPAGGSAIAVNPGGNGDITESQRLWRLERVKSGIGTGIIHEGHLYTISQDGFAECLDLKTGSRVWQERLSGAGSRNSSWSSMLLADGKIYVPNQSGDVFVLRAAPQFELLATNSVNESTNASLAAADGELFFRTDKSLWCFATGK
jgi:outer membrane protein assembly factor BamB